MEREFKKIGIKLDLIDMQQQKHTLEDFDITGRKKNAKGGLNYLMGL
jgi:hypothetical protein